MLSFTVYIIKAAKGIVLVFHLVLKVNHLQPPKFSHKHLAKLQEKLVSNAPDEKAAFNLSNEAAAG